MKNRFRNTDKKHAGVRYNIEQSRNVSLEKLNIDDQNKILYRDKVSYEDESKKNDSQANYETIDSVPRNKSKEAHHKTSRKVSIK